MMKTYYYGLILNFQFFTTLPINLEVPMTEENIERSIRLFPILGLYFGLIYSFVIYFLQNYSPFSNLIIAFIVWLLTIVLTGGIHIDGWMDSSDGFFSYRDQSRRLEIMSDPRLGAFGVIGGIILLLGKFIFIYEILTKTTENSSIYFVLIPILSRTFMAFTLLFIPKAKDKGLGHLFQKAAKKSTPFFYEIYLFALIPIYFISKWMVLNFLLLLASSFIVFLFVKNKAVKWFGGITGDVVGAAVEGLEVFLWFILLLLHYFAMV